MRLSNLAYGLGVFVIIAGIGGSWWVQHKMTDDSAQTGPTVYLANQRIFRFTRLTSAVIRADFTPEKMPLKYVAMDAVTNPSTLANKELAVDLSPNTQLTNGMLIPDTYVPAMNNLLFPVSVSYAQIAGGVVFPGEWVGIQAVSQKGVTTPLVASIYVHEVQDNNGVPITAASYVSTQNGNTRPQPSLLTLEGTETEIKAIEGALHQGEQLIVTTTTPDGN